jgi:hypothetical protein
MLLGLAVAVSAPALKDKPAPETPLLGEWVPEGVTVGGRPATPGADRWVFRADGTYARHASGAHRTGGDLVGDVGQAEGTLDLYGETPGVPPTMCRFRVDGDTLTLAIGHCRAGRPATVEPGPRATVSVMKRVRPAR